MPKIIKNCGVFSPKTASLIEETDEISVRVIPSKPLYRESPGMCGGIKGNSFSAVVTRGEARKLSKKGYWVVFNEEDPEAEVVG
jgi:hypothetical protein